MEAAHEGVNRDELRPLRDLADELGVRRRTLDRVCADAGITRWKFPGDRLTYVEEAAVRAEMARPHRRPDRRHRPDGQPRSPRGRFARADEPQ